MVDTSTPKFRPLRTAWMAVLASALSLAGCGSDDATPKAGPTGTASTGGSDTVVIDGSSTVYRISTAAQEGFAKVDDNVEVVVGNSGTGGGFTQVPCATRSNIVDASRTAKPEEEAKA